MSTPALVHVGDVGTDIVVVIMDESGSPVDVSGATVMTITLKPAPAQSNHKTFAAVLDTDGTDGAIKYTTALPSDIDTDGTWEAQGYVEIGSRKFHSGRPQFQVEANI